MSLGPDVIEQLRDRYRRSLPDKRNQLERLHERLGRGEPCGPEVHAMAHRLAGSGGSYGWPEISDAATRVVLANDAELAPALEGLIAAVADADARAST